MANSDKLELKLTQYGLNRVIKALEDPSLTLALTKIRIGSGDNNEYYSFTEQNPDVSSLRGDLGYTFYVYNKDLLEDGLTVCFRTVIPDDIGGFDIREVGLYETVGGEDHLFAIATQQPIVKPAPVYNYFMNINYYIFLKVQNFADIYDRIVLDVEHAEVTEANLEELMRNFLFAQENLMIQIGKNSELLGYNRPTQILDKVNENKKTFGYITLYKNYASLLDMVSSPDNIFSYWIFDYSRRENLGSTITDLSNNKYYLGTSRPLSYFPHTYSGFQSMFTFDENDSYYLSSEIMIDLYDEETNTDAPFTMAFTVKPIPEYYNETRTLIAKSNRDKGAVVFEVQETGDGALQVRLYTDSNNYLTFTTSDHTIPNTAHAIVLTYAPQEQVMTVYINSKEYVMHKEQEGTEYTHMNPSAKNTLYKYTANVVQTAYVGKVGKPGEPPTSPADLCLENGVPTTNIKWDIEESGDTINASYEGHTAVKDTTYDTDGKKEITHYAYGYWSNGQGTKGPDAIIYLDTQTAEESTKLYNSNFELVDPSDEGFHIVQEGSIYTLLYGGGSHTETAAYPNGNLTKTIYKYDASFKESIYTSPFYAHNSFPEPSPLYKFVPNEGEGTGGIYIPYTGDNWHFVVTEPEEPQEPTEPDPITYTLKYTDGADFSCVGDSTPIELDSPDLTSYIIDKDGQRKDNACSSVGLIAIVKEKLSATNARILALNLCATMGQNPFLTGD